MTATKTADRRKAKWDRPVSRKFYKYIHQQITATCAAAPGINQEYLHDLFDYYLANGQLPTDISYIATIIFSLLIPQIDKAMTRSSRARAAARRRRSTPQLTTSTTEMPAPCNQPNPPAAEKQLPDKAEKQMLRRQASLQSRQDKHRKRLARRALKRKHGSLQILESAPLDTGLNEASPMRR